MRFTIAALAILTSRAIAQIPTQTVVMVPTLRPALQCPAGVACNANPYLINDDVYNEQAITSVIWRTEVVPKIITETATTVVATVRVHAKNAEAQCVKFNPIPRGRPIVYFYINTTTTSYSLTTTTTTSTTTIDADVTAPAGCVREVNRPKPLELPSNEEDVCKYKIGQPKPGDTSVPQQAKPGDTLPQEPSPGSTSNGKDNLGLDSESLIGALMDEL
ncbi:hypothetical protein MMC18_008551 [Xylographa bjoerkii]|nr:hypothetical protein [Xylographa bjoerkii]